MSINTRYVLWSNLLMVLPVRLVPALLYLYETET
jgi:hypothetical protein